jgi:uncharacterized protein (TIGR02145 family)
MCDGTRAAEFSPDMHRLWKIIMLVAAASACSSPGEVASGVSNDELREDAGPDAGDVGDAGANVFVDPRDGKKYPTIRIGENTWLAKNLEYVIPGASWCYGNRSDICASDGRLYSWSVARTACPPGWRLGSDDDWKALETALGMADDQLDLEGYSTERGTDEGTQLKSPTGFGAKMAGFRQGSTYEARGDRTYYWTSKMRDGDVWRRRVANAEATVFRFTNPPDGFAISIRCVR